MNINNIPRINVVNTYRNQQEAKSSEIKSDKSNQKDQLQISAEAKQLLGAQNKASSGTPMERVQELKQLVSTGTYHVEANNIAEKLLPYFKN